MNMISAKQLKNLELMVRLLMSVILLTAGSSKLFSDGGFAAYYAQAFQGELRIVLPSGLVAIYLAVIPFIELALGALLLVNRVRTYALIGWFVFMLTLLIGHYVLQEWSAVNQMLDYFFLGFLCYVLPSHGRWRDFGFNPDTA